MGTGPRGSPAPTIQEGETSIGVREGTPKPSGCCLLVCSRTAGGWNFGKEHTFREWIQYAFMREKGEQKITHLLTKFVAFPSSSKTRKQTVQLAESGLLCMASSYLSGTIIGITYLLVSMYSYMKPPRTTRPEKTRAKTRRIDSKVTWIISHVGDFNASELKV
jgi:hypothetical protein